MAMYRAMFSAVGTQVEERHVLVEGVIEGFGLVINNFCRAAKSSTCRCEVDLAAHHIEQVVVAVAMGPGALAIDRFVFALSAPHGNGGPPRNREW